MSKEYSSEELTKYTLLALRVYNSIPLVKKKSVFEFFSENLESIDITKDSSNLDIDKLSCVYDEYNKIHAFHIDQVVTLCKKILLIKRGTMDLKNTLTEVITGIKGNNGVSSNGKQFEKLVKKKLQDAGLGVYRNSNLVGEPDFIVTLNGRFIFLECKDYANPNKETAHKKWTEHQKLQNIKFREIIKGNKVEIYIAMRLQYATYCTKFERDEL